MNRSLLTFLIVLVTVSFLGGLLLTAFSDRMDAVASPGTDSYSYSLVGYRALAHYLERSGLRVTRRRLEHEPAPEPGLVMVIAEPAADFYTPPAEPDTSGTAPDSLDAASGGSLTAADTSAQADTTDTTDTSTTSYDEDDWWEEYRPQYHVPTLQILPKHVPIASVRRADWVEAIPLRPLDYANAVLDEAGADSARVLRLATQRLHCATLWGDSVWVTAESLQVILPGSRQRPLVWRDSLALAVTWQDPQRDTTSTAPGRVVLVSEPDLFNNQGLARADHARLARGLLEHVFQARQVVFDESRGHPLRALLARELMRFPLVLLFAHFVLLVALAGWGLSRRFGDPRPPRPRAADRSALVTAAANLLAGASDPAELLSLYWDQAVREVLGRFEGLQRTPWHERITQLSRIETVRRRPPRAEELERDVELLQRLDRAPLTRVLAVARRIHHWQGELLHER